MSAVPRPAPLPPAADGMRPITVEMLDEVLAIEVAAYPFPWTRGNFVDSLAAGYPARARYDGRGAMVGYFFAMSGFEEVHLLNVTVDPACQGRGHGRALLAELYRLAAAAGAGAVWLEVRESNERARALYLREGFVVAGRRRDYYPGAAGRREDAILMNLALATGGRHDVE